MIVTDDFSGFSNRWGHVDETPGQITVTTLDNEWLDAGALWQGEGFGYGTFEFDVAVSDERVGPYALLWPDNDVWPGYEIDAFEVHSVPGAGTYAARHYDANPGSGGNEDDRATVYQQPEADATQLHTYSVEWSPPSEVNPNGAIWYAMDGTPYAVETEHVPRDAADGGVNVLPGIGIHLWPGVMGYQDGDNAITLTAFRYSQWSR